MIFTILLILFVIYLIGKYISARSKDSKKVNTAKFGEDISGVAKLIMNIILLGIILLILYVISILF